MSTLTRNWKRRYGDTLVPKGGGMVRVGPLDVPKVAVDLAVC